MQQVAHLTLEKIAPQQLKTAVTLLRYFLSSCGLRQSCSNRDWEVQFHNAIHRQFSPTIKKCSQTLNQPGGEGRHRIAQPIKSVLHLWFQSSLEINFDLRFSAAAKDKQAGAAATAMMDHKYLDTCTEDGGAEEGHGAPPLSLLWDVWPARSSSALSACELKCNQWI